MRIGDLTADHLGHNFTVTGPHDDEDTFTFTGQLVQVHHYYGRMKTDLVAGELEVNNASLTEIRLRLMPADIKIELPAEHEIHPA